MENQISSGVKLSIVVPIYNEEENIGLLLNKVFHELDFITNDYEVICVNDGSSDHSWGKLTDLSRANFKLKLINFRRNFGQTAALSAGFDVANGEIVIPLDADLQNDPADIKRMVEKIESGYDIVSGWRKNRHDNLITRKIPSWLANFLISYFTKVKLHDYGCTLKAYKREIIKEVRLYGEMHRFIPALAVWQGARITEIEVAHHSRIHGQTKYGISRTFRVILDLLTVKFITKYSTRPMHFFGGAGIISLFFGLVCFLASIYLRLIGFATIIQTPLPLLGVFFSMAGLQFILMGLLAEIIMRNYFESGNKPTYAIKEKINF